MSALKPARRARASSSRPRTSKRRVAIVEPPRHPVAEPPRQPTVNAASESPEESSPLAAHIDAMRARGVFVSADQRAARLQRVVQDVRLHVLQKKLTEALQQRFRALLERAEHRLSEPPAAVAQLFVEREIRGLRANSSKVPDDQFVALALARIEPALRCVHWCRSHRHRIFGRSAYGESCSGCRPSKAVGMQAIRDRRAEQERALTEALGRYVARVAPPGWKLTAAALTFPKNRRIALRAGRVTTDLISKNPALRVALEALPDKEIRLHLLAMPRHRGVTRTRKNSSSRR